MKAASLAIAVAILAGGPALAKPAHVARPSHIHHSQPRDSQNSVGTQDPYGVYWGNQEIGRDPDPNIREQLGREYLYGG